MLLQSFSLVCVCLFVTEVTGLRNKAVVHFYRLSDCLEFKDEIRDYYLPEKKSDTSITVYTHPKDGTTDIHLKLDRDVFLEHEVEILGYKWNASRPGYEEVFYFDGPLFYVIEQKASKLWNKMLAASVPPIVINKDVSGSESIPYGRYDMMGMKILSDDIVIRDYMDGQFAFDVFFRNGDYEVWFCQRIELIIDGVEDY